MKKILITSIGRTGTTSISSFLNKIPGVICEHQKIGRRDIPYLFYSQLQDFTKLAKGYFEKRDKEISNLDCDFYIEVNPYLRFADASVLKSLGWDKFFLVRNPKTYLESVFVRDTFSENEYLLSQIPKDSDSFSDKWYQTTRFEKLCWYYSNFHEYVLNSDQLYYRFEDFIKNPDSLKGFLNDMGIDTSAIDTFVMPKQNTSFDYKLRSRVKSIIRKNENYTVSSLDWSSLSELENETYQTLCESLGNKMGY